MTYAEAIGYLTARLPMFTRDGAAAIKKDLHNTFRFCRQLGDPQDRFRSVHIAGTNGKGSTSHMLASVLASAGYRTGLYTSPHLADFRERIRINGKMIGEEAVVDFVEGNQPFIEAIEPSFFEVTVAMAFDHFAKQKVDIAVVEVGLGGRLDSTNIIRPELSVITNIGLDHTSLLGDTLEEIASEKAGIIKQRVPVVVSEKDPAVAQVFVEKAAILDAPLRFATDEREVTAVHGFEDALRLEVLEKSTQKRTHWTLDLSGRYQTKNVLGVLAAVDELRKKGWKITDGHLREGLAHVKRNTGLCGRWQTLSTNPLTICDTGHNADGIRQVVENLRSVPHERLHFLLGAMRDKDLDGILPLLPREAVYYFCRPDMPRALPETELQAKARAYGLCGTAHPTVLEALASAKAQCQQDDLIFVGGSTFVVAEVLGNFA